MTRTAQWVTAAGLVVLGLSGCTVAAAESAPSNPPSSAAPSATTPARSECENTALTLSLAQTNLTAGETVEVTTAPEHCLVSDEWEGQIVVRLESKDPAERDAAVARNENPDTATGSRIEAGTRQPVEVKIPAGLEGDGYLMLVPDQNCEDFADCYYPYVEISITAPVR